MRKFLGFTAAFGLAFGLSQTANAGEVTRVASSFEEDNPFDLHIGAAYTFDFKKASVLREWSNPATRENRLVRDLTYKQRRQTVTPSLEIGLYRDLSIYAALPIVVSDNRSYSLDQSEGDGCIFPEDALNEQPTCVNKTNSTSIRDGIIPANGWDARQRGSAYEQFEDPATELIFVAPKRTGLDQIIVGIKYGIFNQTKYSHLPNWVVGLEGRFSIGKPMQLTRDIDLSDPDTNHSVGRGQHDLGVWTALSRRFRYLEPFFGANWYMALSANRTQFQDFGGAQTESEPMMQTGTQFGTEIIPWENKEKVQKVGIILAGNAQLHLKGRAYSEVWELLADSPALAGTFAPGETQCNTAAGRTFAENNPLDPDDYLQVANNAANSGGCQKYNGITTVNDYADIGMTIAMNFWMGPYARLNLGANLQTQTRHFVTSAGRGDANRAAGGDPNVVDPGTADVNPVRRDVIDNVGRRYAIDNVFQVIGFANFFLTF